MFWTEQRGARRARTASGRFLVNANQPPWQYARGDTYLRLDAVYHDRCGLALLDDLASGAHHANGVALVSQIGADGDVWKLKE